MKNILLSLTMLMSVLIFAQEEMENLGKIHRNEIGVNLFDLVAVGAVEVQYERFLDNNQSLQFNATLFDSYGYWEVGDIKKNSTHSLAAAYRFYLGKKEHSGLFFYPYAKYMFGTQEVESYWYGDGQGGDRHITKEIEMDNFSLGFGLGYKWLFSNRYTLGLDMSLGRTFSDEMSDRFSQVEFKTGLSFGVRF